MQAFRHLLLPPHLDLRPRLPAHASKDYDRPGREREKCMANNRGVVYEGPGKVAVHNIDYPVFKDPQGKPIEHGVILKVVSTNICGSDQHMVRGRTTAPKGLVLGHEILGEVIEKGKDVLFLNVGDLV